MKIHYLYTTELRIGRGQPLSHQRKVCGDSDAGIQPHKMSEG